MNNSIYRIVHLALKDLRLLTRDRGGLFFALIMPIIMAVFFGTVFSGAGDNDGAAAIDALVVDLDQTDASRAFIQTLSDAPELNLEPSEPEAARDLVRRGKAVAFIELTPGFGNAKATAFDPDVPTIVIGVDPGEPATAGMLQGALTKYAAEDMQTAFTDPTQLSGQLDASLAELDTVQDTGSIPGYEHLKPFLNELKAFADSNAAADADETGAVAFNGMQPLLIEQESIAVESTGGLNNAYAISFPQGLVWGIIGVVTTFVLTLVTERKSGTLLRLQVTPLNRWEILAGKGLACWLALMAVALIIMLLGTTVFGVQIDWLKLLPALVLIGVCFSGLMMFLSVLGNTEKATSGLSWAVMMPLAMLGGGMIPLAIMPGWMRGVSDISPIKWAVISIEGATWRGFSWVEILPALLVLAVLGVVLFILGTRLFKWHSG